MSYILRLDNSANMYPLIANKHNQNIFRLSVELKDDVDPDTLQRAVDLVLQRFKPLSMRLMRGFFWYYLDENPHPYLITEEDGKVFDRIELNNINGYNMRIRYYKKRISMEFYHVICDGAGGLEMLKSILNAYFRLKGYCVSDRNILTYDSLPDIRESEDSFKANYIKQPLKDCKVSDLKGTPAFIIEGDYYKHTKCIVTLITESDKLYNLAKQAGATITEYLTAIFAESVKRAYGESGGDCNIMVPVNLRKIFDSVSLRNFSLFSRVSLNLSDSFESYLVTAHEALLRDTDRKTLLRRISTTVRGEKLPVLRAVPLSVKRAIFTLSNRFVGKSKRTATLSNLGIIDLNKEYSELIDYFHFELNSNRPTPINIAVVTFNNKLTISFTNSIRDNSLIKCFAELLIERGIAVRAVGNYGGDESVIIGCKRENHGK